MPGTNRDGGLSSHDLEVLDAVLALVAAITASLIWTPPGHIAMLAALMALLPLATVGNPNSVVGKLLDSVPLAWTGRISYSLYLWQQLFLPHRAFRFCCAGSRHCRSISCSPF